MKVTPGRSVMEQKLRYESRNEVVERVVCGIKRKKLVSMFLILKAAFEIGNYLKIRKLVILILYE